MIKRFLSRGMLSLGMLLVLVLALASCDTAYKTNYLRDIEEAKTYSAKYDKGIVVQKGDKLRILVTSLRNPELTVPFNAHSVAQAGVNLPVGNVANVAPADTTSSYLVDASGKIQFPVIGDVEVQGLSLDQVSDLIRTKLTAGRYLTDAHVITKFANLRIYLLGAFQTIGAGSSSGVSDRGSFHLDNAQTNILELMSQVGGLTEQADFSKLNVIRRVGNEYVYYRLDLLSKSIFDSPAFYLQQNDIVYAEYRYRTRDTEQKILSSIGYLSTAVSTVVSALAFIALFKR
ncbi:polysaccharide biosynthesis/export family protein [Porphyromonas sp.]